MVSLRSGKCTVQLIVPALSDQKVLLGVLNTLLSAVSEEQEYQDEESRKMVLSPARMQISCM